MAYNQVVIGDEHSNQSGIDSNPLAIKIRGDGNDAIVTDSGELWITETERENNVFVQYTAAYSADTYVILVSKDNVLWPHKIQGQNGDRIDVTAIYYAIDLVANTSASVRLGVITRIDGTNADIKYVIGIPFEAGATKAIIVESLMGIQSQVKLDFDANGVLQHGLSNLSEDDVAAVNTGAALPSPGGNITPGLGDVILKYDHTAGSSTFGVFLFYHNTD